MSHNGSIEVDLVLLNVPLWLQWSGSLRSVAPSMIADWILPVQWPNDPNLVPTPRELFERLEAGRISRLEFQAAMAVHARELIGEIEETKLNPVQAGLEEMKNRAAAIYLTLRHGEGIVREVLAALSQVEDFLPARFLWNALHPHVPLHCFFRSNREPVIRVQKLDVNPQRIRVQVEHGKSTKGQGTREELVFRRDRRQELQLVERRRI